MTRTALIEKGHVALERNASPEEILRGFIRVAVQRGGLAELGLSDYCPRARTADTGYVSA